jgi:hypothetical protein
MNTFHQFGLNPEEFIRKVGLIINKEKAMEIVQKLCMRKRKIDILWIFLLNQPYEVNWVSILLWDTTIPLGQLSLREGV